VVAVPSELSLTPIRAIKNKNTKRRLNMGSASYNSLHGILNPIPNLKYEGRNTHNYEVTYATRTAVFVSCCK
jgi:hypothetical protein